MIPYSKDELDDLQLDVRELFNDSSLCVQQLGWAAVAIVGDEMVAYDDDGGDWYVLSFFDKPVTGIADVLTRQQVARSGQPANEPPRLASWRPFHSDSSLLERALSALISIVLALYVINISNIVVSDPSIRPVLQAIIIVNAVIAASAIVKYLLPLKIKRSN